jgi:hypothetical protein
MKRRYHLSSQNPESGFAPLYESQGRAASHSQAGSILINTF